MSELFEYYIETDTFHFKYAKGKPAVETREYHDYNEFVFFIQGKASLIAKNIQQELIPGSIVIIPKEQFHQFFVEDSENYVRCILGFYETPEMQKLVNQIMNSVKIFNTPNRKIVSVFEKLTEIVESDLSDEEKAVFVKGSLLHLLIYVKKYIVDAICGNTNLSPIIVRTLAIIDESYSENISVKDIADRLFVSYLSLTHKFSKEMNMPIYKYITKKRLAEAHKLIIQGENITSAARNSGFNDYSCFYRLYKKYYT